MICGVDIGGTFTDAVVLDDEGRIHVGKRSSTPPNFEDGFFDALGAAAEAAGLGLEEVLARSSHLIHGTTVATNAMVELNGARVGLLTTRGHRDVLPMMRSIGRVRGRSVEDIVRLGASRKPEPIVPRSLIEEVDERVDSRGEVVVELDEAGARAAIARLLEAGVEAIAISFLWSFLNQAHELRVRELVEELAPEVFVTTSSQLVPKWGEYERTAAVAIGRGDPRRPLDLAAVADKYRRCAAVAAAPPDAAQVERTIELVAELERIDDADEIRATLGPSPGRGAGSAG